MESPARRSSAKDILMSVAGRMLVGYLIFKAFGASTLADSASVNDGCSAEALRNSMKESIATYGSSEDGQVSQAAIGLFKKCNAEFVAKNRVSEDVKKTVDDWLGMELDQADPKSLFMAYQQALMNEKPEETSEAFKDDCKNMGWAYELFRDNTVELAKYIDVSSGALLMEDGQVSADERALFNFVQYSQFCSLLTDSNSSQ